MTTGPTNPTGGVILDERLELVRYAELPSGIRIAYDEFGSPGDPAMLLIMGLGMQMLGWDQSFCELLVERGYRVIRFDNRDIGLSTKLDAEGRPNIVAGALGAARHSPYLLSDMAADTSGLLDHLEIDSAHVAGASMGGMIGQTLAARHPERVRSLCSIMSGPGGRKRETMPRMSVIGTLLARHHRALRKLRRWEEARPMLQQAVKVCDRAKHALAPRARYGGARAVQLTETWLRRLQRAAYHVQGVLGGTPLADKEKGE